MGFFLLPKTEFDVLNFSLFLKCCERFLFKRRGQRAEMGFPEKVKTNVHTILSSDLFPMCHIKRLDT